MVQAVKGPSMKVKTGSKRSNVWHISEHHLTSCNSDSSAGATAISEEGSHWKMAAAQTESHIWKVDSYHYHN